MSSCVEPTWHPLAAVLLIYALVCAWAAFAEIYSYWKRHR